MSIPDTSTDVRRLVIPSDFRGQRLDKVLAQLLPDYSRARLQAWLKAGAIEVDGVAVAPRTAVRGGEQLHARLGIVADAVSITAQAIPLELVYEDAAILVVHKPAGLVMHPGAGNPNGTLQNALLHHDPGLGAVPRAGIVHRLDKDTSGLLVVARNLCAHKHLVAALAARSIQREYEAVVCGALIAGGTVDAPIGRHPADRKRMAVRAHVGPGARAARTHYRVLQRFAAHTHLRLQLETGRTHQIRVHMQHIRRPLVGDPVYGRRLAIPAGASESLRQTLQGFSRQALHASRLALTHPVSGESLAWAAPPPVDFQDLLAALSAHAREVAANG